MTTKAPSGAAAMPMSIFLEERPSRCMEAESRDHALFRLARAEAVGLTYEEYTLEILERGRYLSAADTERIAKIKDKRICNSSPKGEAGRR